MSKKRRYSWMEEFPYIEGKSHSQAWSLRIPISRINSPYTYCSPQKGEKCKLKKIITDCSVVQLLIAIYLRI
jgi:hypothetical protein